MSALLIPALRLPVAFPLLLFIPPFHVTFHGSGLISPTAYTLLTAKCAIIQKIFVPLLRNFTQIRICYGKTIHLTSSMCHPILFQPNSR